MAQSLGGFFRCFFGRLCPFYLPSVAWVSLVSILVTLPSFPGSAWIVSQLAAVNFLAVVTPVLAYAGLALTGREKGPEIAPLLAFIGRDRIIARLRGESA